MTHSEPKNLHRMPLKPLFEGMEIPAVGSDILNRSIESMPPVMQISLKSLSSIYPIDVGEFGHRHRRILVIDRNTVEVMRTGEYLRNPYPAGFIYCYSFEDNIIAGHYNEEHSEGFLFFKFKEWKTDHYKPKIKIGCCTRENGDVGLRVLTQQNTTSSFAPPILLFLMYSPIAAGKEGVGLERTIHRQLKDKGYWLKTQRNIKHSPPDLHDSDQESLLVQDVAPGNEWFKAPVGEAYSVAYNFNMKILERNSVTVAQSVR
jgi:hypothetical protein